MYGSQCMVKFLSVIIIFCVLMTVFLGKEMCTNVLSLGPFLNILHQKFLLYNMCKYVVMEEEIIMMFRGF